MNDWVGHVFDASVCEYKADHRGRVLPLDFRQWPVPELWPQLGCECGRTQVTRGYSGKD